MQHRSSSNIFELLITEFPFCFSDKICDDRGPRKMRFDQYVGHCIVSNFRLHLDSHSQIMTATEPPSAPTSARSNLIRLPILDYPAVSNSDNVFWQATHELQNGPCRKTFELEYPEIFIKLWYLSGIIVPLWLIHGYVTWLIHTYVKWYFGVCVYTCIYV